eukprot:CAMPEP_0113498378 /NCGR_PEP_ID=MMETSP0014_2-20120614/31138_1 /TAXON_ID=2857 /ORGANISM="Nitzschia sp." /LENGTH=713 /DNA_ID=CAMNT_0000392393 /DNA_START=449 /DNA_END=2590 /DNA_ORIENTATION=- /assembly_acc=CAM_ASM_000159
MESKPINLRKLAKETIGTPHNVYNFVMNHTIQKVYRGLLYLDHIQSITIISLLCSAGNNGHVTTTVRSWGDSKAWHYDDLSLIFPLDSYNPNNLGNHSVHEPAQIVATSKPPHDLYGGKLQFATHTYGMAGNSGDEIQSLAHIQFLPYINGKDSFYRRDADMRNKGAMGNLIMNAWYGRVWKWPPSHPELYPTLTSMHWEHPATERANSSDSIEFFRNYTKTVGPVGARDTATLKFFQSLNIPTYLSLCMTTTIQNGCHCTNCPACSVKNEVFVHDVETRWGTKLPEGQGPEKLKQIIANATKLTASFPKHIDQHKATRKKFLYAHHLLSVYAYRAKLVITGRLHSALPALALGVPVIFVDLGKLAGGARSRLSGIFELFHLYRPFEDPDWKWDNLNEVPPNPGVHKVDRFRASFWNYLSRRNPFYHDAAKLHGMIPFQRLGGDLQDDNVQSSFHILFSKTTTVVHWRLSRAIEYIFFHHPNAYVTIHVPKETYPLLENTRRLQIFREVGYKLVVKPLVVEDLVVKAASNRKSQSGCGATSGLEDLVAKAMGDEELLKVLILHSFGGGIYVDPDVYFLKPVPANISQAISTNMSLLILSKENTEEVVKQILFPEDNGLVSTGPATTRKILLSKISGSTDEPIIRLGASCFSTMQNDTDGARKMALFDIKYAAEVSLQHHNHLDFIAKNSICDDLLHKYCIFCDEIHTEMPAPP